MMKFCSILVTLEPSGFNYRKKAQGGTKTRLSAGLDCVVRGRVHGW